MGIFTNQAHTYSTGILQADQQQNYDATKSALLELVAESQKSLLKGLIDLLGEQFIKDNLTFHIDRLEFNEEVSYTTVKIPVGPNGANRNEVNTLLVFNTDPTHKRLLKTRTGRHSHIELYEEEYSGEDLRDILAHWDRFTN